MTSIPFPTTATRSRAVVASALRLARLALSAATRPVMALGAALSAVAASGQLGADAEKTIGRGTGARC